MTNQAFPITPPPELVVQWYLAAKAMPVDQWVTDVATAAAQWGADQELEACCEWLRSAAPAWERQLRAARRPNPPSLKEQALLAIDVAVADGRLSPDVSKVVRSALKALPND